MTARDTLIVFDAHEHGCPARHGDGDCDEAPDDDEYDDGLVLIAGVLYDAETLDEAEA